MSAKFIKHGVFLVTYHGKRITVLAANGCDALNIAAKHFGIGEATLRAA